MKNKYLYLKLLKNNLGSEFDYSFIQNIKELKTIEELHNYLLELSSDLVDNSIYEDLKGLYYA